MSDRKRPPATTSDRKRTWLVVARSSRTAVRLDAAVCVRRSLFSVRSPRRSVTLRLIAERLALRLPSSLAKAGSTFASYSKRRAEKSSRREVHEERLKASDLYVQGEIVNKRLPKLPQGSHVYCSVHNTGAADLMRELRAAHWQFKECTTTQEVEAIESCDVMLIYLNGLTWTRGHASEALADEVRRALDAGVDYVLAHEMMGRGGQDARHGCEFSAFFACEHGTTPADLLRGGLYAKIAVALKGGPWREPSLVMLAQALLLHTGAGPITQEPSLGAELSATQLLRRGLSFAKNLTEGSSRARFQLRTIQVAEPVLQASSATRRPPSEEGHVADAAPLDIKT